MKVSVLMSRTLVNLSGFSCRIFFDQLQSLIDSAEGEGTQIQVKLFYPYTKLNYFHLNIPHLCYFP